MSFMINKISQLVLPGNLPHSGSFFLISPSQARIKQTKCGRSRRKNREKQRKKELNEDNGKDGVSFKMALLSFYHRKKYL